MWTFFILYKRLLRLIKKNKNKNIFRKNIFKTINKLRDREGNKII